MKKRVENVELGRRGFIDLFILGTLIVEQKSAGLDLGAKALEMPTAAAPAANRRIALRAGRR